MIEIRLVPFSERIKIVGSTLPETIVQNHTIIKGHLWMLGRALRREGDVTGFNNTCRLTKLIDENQETIEDIEKRIASGHYEAKPETGLKTVQELLRTKVNPQLRIVENYISSVATPADTNKLKVAVAEYLEQSVTLGLIIGLPENQPIPLYVGYPANPILLIARKHFPEDFKELVKAFL